MLVTVNAALQSINVLALGTDTIALYRMFQSLRGEARAAGGELYSILGSKCSRVTSPHGQILTKFRLPDHEVMNGMAVSVEELVRQLTFVLDSTRRLEICHERRHRDLWLYREKAGRFIRSRVDRSRMASPATLSLFFIGRTYTDLFLRLAK